MFVFPEMTPELQEYLDYQKIKYEDYEVFKKEGERLKSFLPEGFLNSYYQEKKIWICRDDNAGPKVYKKFSLSGKYELHITNHETGPGTWGYSKGKIFEGEKFITEVCRNYGAFPYLFIEDHPNGEFLICGTDYQGSTVVDLKSGKTVDFLPKEAEKGHGFCWSEYRYDKESQILIVNGCYWACPYEFKFYDFSDPMNGWSELKFEKGIYVDADDKWPTIESGIVKCYQTEYYDYDDDEERKEQPTLSIKTFIREGFELKLFNEWVSDDEQIKRQKQKEANTKYDQWLADFKANDPTYLLVNELAKDPMFSPENNFSIGITHENWCPDFKGTEKRICKRIVQRSKNDSRYTVDLEWAYETGPIKLVIYKEGNKIEDKFFEHNEMSQALDM